MTREGDALIAHEATSTHLGLYIHVPFCARKCGYCAFNSVPIQDGDVSGYSRALAVEIQAVARDARLVGRSFATVYIGGGTPSLLPRQVLQSSVETILQTLPVERDAEVTIEANPESFDSDLAALISAMPAGRVSLGAQSFCPNVLEILDRSHDPDTVRRAVSLARHGGVRGVSLDLIYGTPTESLEDWNESLDAVLELKPDHVSCYCLSIEGGTPLAEAVRARRLPAPNEILQREMYTAASSRLTTEGYEHYEISNFAKAGHRSRHNMGYWRRAEYVGLGPSAHSFLGGRRWRNHGNVGEYNRRVLAGGSPADWSEVISPGMALEETVMLALRTSDGLDLNAIKSGWGLKAAKQLLDGASQLVGNGLLLIDGQMMRIPRSAYFVSDDIIARLLTAVQ